MRFQFLVDHLHFLSPLSLSLNHDRIRDGFSFSILSVSLLSLKRIGDLLLYWHLPGKFFRFTCYWIESGQFNITFIIHESLVKIILWGIMVHFDIFKGNLPFLKLRQSFLGRIFALVSFHYPLRHIENNQRRSSQFFDLLIHDCYRRWIQRILLLLFFLFNSFLWVHSLLTRPPIKLFLCLRLKPILDLP